MQGFKQCLFCLGFWGMLMGSNMPPAIASHYFWLVLSGDGPDPYWGDRYSFAHSDLWISIMDFRNVPY